MLWCTGDQCPDNNYPLHLIYCAVCKWILVLVLQHCSSELLPGCAWEGLFELLLMNLFIYM